MKNLFRTVIALTAVVAAVRAKTDRITKGTISSVKLNLINSNHENQI